MLLLLRYVRYGQYMEEGPCALRIVLESRL